MTTKQPSIPNPPRARTWGAEAWDDEQGWRRLHIEGTGGRRGFWRPVPVGADDLRALAGPGRYRITWRASSRATFGHTVVFLDADGGAAIEHQDEQQQQPPSQTNEPAPSQPVDLSSLLETLRQQPRAKAPAAKPVQAPTGPMGDILPLTQVFDHLLSRAERFYFANQQTQLAILSMLASQDRERSAQEAQRAREHFERLTAEMTRASETNASNQELWQQSVQALQGTTDERFAELQEQLAELAEAAERLQGGGKDPEAWERKAAFLRDMVDGLSSGPLGQILGRAAMAKLAQQTKSSPDPGADGTTGE